MLIQIPYLQEYTLFLSPDSNQLIVPFCVCVCVCFFTSVHGAALILSSYMQKKQGVKEDTYQI